MENKVLCFSYKDTDKKIEVSLYDLVFEINKEKIIDKDIDDVNKRSENEVENEIKELIGDKFEKIKYKKAISLQEVQAVFKKYIDDYMKQLI